MLKRTDVLAITGLFCSDSFYFLRQIRWEHLFVTPLPQTHTHTPSPTPMEKLVKNATNTVIMEGIKCLYFLHHKTLILNGKKSSMQFLLQTFQCE